MTAKIEFENKKYFTNTKEQGISDSEGPSDHASRQIGLIEAKDDTGAILLTDEEQRSREQIQAILHYRAQVNGGKHKSCSRAKKPSKWGRFKHWCGRLIKPLFPTSN